MKRSRSTLPAICVLCGEFGVKRLELFGSAMRTDFSLDRSDIDFLIEWYDGTIKLERWWGLLQALRVLLGRDVDLIDETSIRNWRCAVPSLLERGKSSSPWTNRIDASRKDKIMNFARLLPVSAAMLAVAFSLAAQAEPMHVRGTLTEFDSDKITVAKRDGGVEPIAISQDTKFLAVKPIGVEQIKPGSYIGVAGTPRKDGSIKALGVMVFPPSMKGVSEGHFPWDLRPGSTMTNATVAEVEKSAPGREVVVKYKGGSQRILDR